MLWLESTMETCITANNRHELQQPCTTKWSEPHSRHDQIKKPKQKLMQNICKDEQLLKYFKGADEVKLQQFNVQQYRIISVH